MIFMQGYGSKKLSHHWEIISFRRNLQFLLIISSYLKFATWCMALFSIMLSSIFHKKLNNFCLVYLLIYIKSYSKILICCRGSSQLKKPGEWFQPLFFDTWKFWRQFTVLFNIYLFLTVAFCNQEWWQCQL